MDSFQLSMWLVCLQETANISILEEELQTAVPYATLAYMYEFLLFTRQEKEYLILNNEFCHKQKGIIVWTRAAFPLPVGVSRGGVCPGLRASPPPRQI